MIVDLKDMNPRAIIEIGFVAYLDHCDNWITDTMKFTTSEQNIIDLWMNSRPRGEGTTRRLWLMDYMLLTYALEA